MRGEHSTLYGERPFTVGSSPRARGTCRPGVLSSAAVWLIPACAGNISYQPFQGPEFRAHPRVRGEHGEPMKFGKGEAGSSPRARGTWLQLLRPRF